MEKNTEQEAALAWEKYVDAHVAHHGHDEAGQGSPITELVLDHWHKKYAELHPDLMKKRKSDES